jgi:hypothetical protein
MQPSNRLRQFDPVKVARFETQNWVAYYQKQWVRLLRVSVLMAKESFGLSTWQAIYAAYLVARAEIAAAPFPDNDIPRAEQYMWRFYSLLKRLHGEAFDPSQVARLEVNWWVVHRQLFGQAENQPLVEALTALNAAFYGVEPARVREAAVYRAEAMIYSDRWVNEGRVSGSPLIGQVEEALVRSYTALSVAVAPAGASARPPDEVVAAATK